MATSVTPKVLGQSKPAGTTLTDIYTVPASTNTVISHLALSNPGGTADTFRVSVAIAGAGDATSQYTHYDISLGANEAIELLKGATLAATDKVRVRSNGGNITFTLFGEEIA